MSDVEITGPDERLTVTFKGEETELFMSFKRLNAHVRSLGDPNNLSLIVLDPDLAESAIRLALVKDLKEAPDFEVGETDLSMADYDAILMWVQEHLAYFFVRRFQQTGSQLGKMEPVAARLKSQLLGLES